MKKNHIKLSDKDREYLEQLIKSGSLKAKTFKRATALLELDRGKTIRAVSSTLHVSFETVSSWRDKYKEEALLMLNDKPRSGRPPVIDGAARAKITALACSKPPKGHAKWDLRLLANRVVELGYCEHISHTYAGQILKKTNSSLI